MIEIGLKAPTSLKELQEISGISAGIIERRGRELLAAVERGLGVPENELPRFTPGRRWDRDQSIDEATERLRLERNKKAEELGLDPGFLISRALLEEIARRKPTTVEELAAVPDVRQWQIEALGLELLAGVAN
jgi:ribonuclease D